jgi:hypothetical protein
MRAARPILVLSVDKSVKDRTIRVKIARTNATININRSACPLRRSIGSAGGDAGVMRTRNKFIKDLLCDVSDAIK